MSDDMARKTGTELGKPLPTLKAHRPGETIREEPFYKATKEGKLAGWRMRPEYR
jgi:hypothetical protein